MKIKVFLIGIILLMGVSVRSTENISSAQAMFIYNFLRHVKWPEGSTGSTFVIGIYGSSETHSQLLTYTTNRRVGTKPIEVKKISSVDEAVECQLVFVSANQSSKIPSFNSKIGNKPCLIISETEGSTEIGATIEFLVIDSRLKFRINEAQAQKQRLVISRALLDMAV
ncbi:MAG: YfiR family protein [Bacteroidales bacterium]|nr:YfiR family protein [Bacteroidales bacterium]